MALEKMKKEILELIKNKPKHYSVLIKRNEAFFNWVKENTLIESENFIEEIYSALYQETNICPQSNKRKIYRISEGWINCGPAEKCECTRKQLSKSVKAAKENITIKEQQAINKKREETMLSKFGVKYSFQREDVIAKLSSPRIDIEVHNKLNDYQWLDNEYNNKKRTLVDIAAELNVYYSTVKEYCKKHGFNIRQRTNYSLLEKEVASYLESLSVAYEVSNWDILGNREIDIYLPDYKIAIECNGTYWHTEQRGKNKNYHLDKTNRCKEAGIHLIHIWEHSWLLNKDLIKSRLGAKIVLNKTVYARKCKVQEVTYKESLEFLKKSHIQRSCLSSVRYGLYYEDELVALMTFGKARYKKDIEWELLRYCSKQGINIVGGAGKLFAKFIRMYNPNSIISYSDRMWNTGNLYEKIGFSYSHSTDPAYYYTQDYLLVENRVKYQKHKLKDQLDHFDPNLTEWENMQANGYDRIWDCGNDVWIWKKGN